MMKEHDRQHTTDRQTDRQALHRNQEACFTKGIDSLSLHNESCRQAGAVRCKCLPGDPDDDRAATLEVHPVPNDDDVQRP